MRSLIKDNNAFGALIGLIILVALVLVIMLVVSVLWGFLAFVGMLCVGLGLVSAFQKGSIEHPYIMTLLLVGLALMVVSHFGFEIMTFENPLMSWGLI